MRHFVMAALANLYELVEFEASVDVGIVDLGFRKEDCAGSRHVRVGNTYISVYKAMCVKVNL